MQVTFEQHKENLSRMFRQYQQQETAGSLSRIRSISGASQEPAEIINGPHGEEAAPSTVIELNVDELSLKFPDSASSATITPSPIEAANERGHASITVSNILARAEEEDQLAQESSKSDGKETETAVIEKNTTDDLNREPNQQEPVTEASTDKSTGDAQSAGSSLTERHGEEHPETDGTNVTETDKMSVTVDAQTTVTDETSDSEDNKGQSSTSMTEDSLNEADIEPPVASDPEGKNGQMSPENMGALDNRVLGGASFFNEDLVHMSDTEYSQEDSSYVSAAAAGDEGENAPKMGDENQDEEGKKNDQEGQEVKSKVSEITIPEETEESEASEPYSYLESQRMDAPPAETPEQNLTEPTKEKVEDERSSSITDPATSDQRPSDTTLPSTAEEGAAAAAPDTASVASPSQTSDISVATTEEALPSAPDSSTAPSRSDSQKSADSGGKTKEIKIARLDVSNVALDTERLELKETSTTVRNARFSLYCIIEMYYF